MYSFLNKATFVHTSETTRPYVTLTFAQSLDGKIAGKQGQQLILSGKESMKATHLLRSMHDAILVGIGTVVNDNPRLTVRLDEHEQAGSPDLHHPQPVILDSTLRFPTSAKLVLPESPKKPWIFTGPLHDGTRKKELEALGAKVFIIGLATDGHLSISELLTVLGQESIRSVMVEGGAGVISSFLKSRLIDSVLITVAPVFVGREGVSAVQDAEVAPTFGQITYHPLGRDIMMVAKPIYQGHS